MDLRNLQAFVTIAETGSFSEAGSRLFLTQPAVSKRLAALEEELGTPLFDRIGRRVSLTEAGRALLPRARRILETVEDSRRAISNLSGRVEGPLRLGTSHHIGLHRLPPLLREFYQRYPRVELDIRFLDSEEGIDAVESGELELALVTLPAQGGKSLPNVTHEPIWSDPLAVVVAPDHPLAGRGQVVPEELMTFPMVLPGRGTHTREHVERAFAPFGGPLQPQLSTNYLETLKMLVAVGLGWSVLPLTMLDAEVRTLEVRGIALHRKLGLVQHPRRTLSNAGMALRELLLTTGGDNRD